MLKMSEVKIWILFLIFNIIFGIINSTISSLVKFSIEEEVPIGTIIGSIPIKPGLNYRFNENVQEFTLNPNTGEISTSIIIDREKLSNDNFQLVALSSHPAYPIEILIQIFDINDNTPQFLEPVITVTFSESATIGTRVFLDPAQDLDIGSNTVKNDYEIVDGNEYENFQLVVSPNPSSDIPFLYLETSKSLDREIKSKYELNISASDGGNPKKIGYGLIIVNILDTNDSPPLFDHSDYVVSLNESVESGSFVLQVRATDNDDGENGRVSYYLDESENQFSVNSESGVISTVGSTLLCGYNCPEQRSKCKSRSCVFTVFARDYGIPRQDGRTYVTVNLLDANDHDPIIKFRYFPETALAATVDENASNGSVVAAISATDFDEGLNGETIVRILSGNELNHFRLESTPSFQLLRVNGILDREKFGKYNLTLIASDKGTPPRSSVSFLLVEVNDINDHEPIFGQTEYTATLRELIPIGSYVESFLAKDEDTGINSQVYYSIISGNEYGWFGLDSESGLLTTRQQLDREIKNVIVLNISARDGGPNPKWAFTTIKITILDENDQIPQFQNENINITISENSPIGTLITTLSAIDLDQGTNGSISYYLSSPSQYESLLHLDSSTGQLINKLRFDREIKSEYNIQIIAKDKGLPPLSSTVTINLKIKDVDDNYPVFYPLEYFIPISKYTLPNTQIGQVKASDLDEDKRLIYSLTTKSKYFSIESETGIITLIQSISDNQIEKMYTLNVNVEDRGGNKCEEDAVVRIIINEDPKLAKVSQIFKFSIKEGKLNEIGRIGISDANKIIILNGDIRNEFKVNENKMLIPVKDIDRELTEKYNLTLLITKNSGYELVNVEIEVEDINDSIPVFDSNIPNSIEIDEDSTIGSTIIQIKASDNDAGDNGKIIYSIKNQNSNGFFSINPNTGLIKLRKNLRDQKLNESLKLEIEAKDGGKESLTSVKILEIKIKNVNIHNPVFKYSQYETGISESTPLNTRFYTLTGTDSDPDYGFITYEISDGNENGKFGIFPDGTLYVKKSLNREIEDYYSLIIKGKDNGIPPRSSTVSLIINIIDENNSVPVFTNSTFTFYLNENEEKGTFVGKLSGNDNDIGRNSELNYYISGISQDFMVDERSGYIRSLRKFDREELLASTGQIFSTIEVIVKDNGIPQLSSSATVRVYIEDENDNSPIFNQNSYHGFVSEGSPIGFPILRISASDMDSGLNSEIRYLLKSEEGEEDPYFKIDELNGGLIIGRPLDRELIPIHKFQVIAYDLSSDGNKLSSSVEVIIEIIDENDNAPEFAQSDPSIIISETQEVGSELMKFSGSDEDSGLNSLITYSISGGNKHEVFRIDPNTGTLYLNKGLDYEKINIYTLNITASDSGSPKLSSNIQFTVHVQDYNDNSPTFPSTAIFKQITEGIPINSTIVTINAEDGDSGLNGKIIYSIHEQEPTGDYFGIDPEEGRIYNKREIDREITQSFRLIIKGTDESIPIHLRLSSLKLVTIIVEDLNDNEPEFISMNSGILYKTQSNKIGSEILKIQSIDPDSDSNGIITYEITNGDNSIFSIDRNTGSLTLKKSLNNNIQPRYQLTIKTSDEAPQLIRKSSELYLTIIGVDDINNNIGLKCIGNPKNPSIFENERIGSSIGRIECKNIKENDNEIEYYITNITSHGKELQRYFEIDVKRGIITTTKILDREIIGDNIQITVFGIILSSNGLITSNTTVDVEILDRNDSPPSFNQRNMYINISESVPINYRVTTVTARDEDIIGNITYSLLNDFGKFIIHETKGEIRINKNLDREEKDEYELIVEAWDGIQGSQIKLNIKILDENNNPPLFINNGIFSFDIPENSSIGKEIGKLTSSDPDIGLNGLVTYSVISHWANDIFALNPQSGVFTLTNKLDYEDTQHYIFVVQGEDSGSKSLSSTATVYFNIIDINNNYPIFDSMTYTKEIFENISIGSSVITLKASDLDSGLNGEIRYWISGGNEDESFEINSDNGSIFTIKELNREKIEEYILIITASDKGIPNSLSTTTQVLITIKDINDEFPEFSTSNQTTFLENQPPNTLVTSIKGIDKDEGRNGYIEYILNNERDIFNLGQDGLLRVNRVLDRENKSNYTLNITARDKGEPPKSSTQILLIRILDVNDNSPQFNKREYFGSVMENSSIGTNVFKVKAIDFDEGENGSIRYSIVDGDPNNDFIIGEDTGVVRVGKNLDYERVDSYVLTIRAEDNGEEVKYDTTTGLINIINVNDNPPQFLDSPYIIRVRENWFDGSLPIITLKGIDGDGDSGIRYLLSDGDKGTFKIGSKNGELTINRKLDREKQDEYYLTVVAMDSGSPRLTGTGTVKIIVEDENDNPPTFGHDRYEVIVEGTTQPGTVITKVSATDSDIGINAKILYSIIGDSPFDIDKNSGEIKMGTDIKSKIFNLRVKATDSNPLHPLTSITNLTIRIESTKNRTSVFRGFQEGNEVRVSLPEGNKAGIFVFGLSVDDLYVGYSYSGVGSNYYLGGPDGDKFQIDQNTGVVKTIRSIKSKCQFEIYGNDPKSPQSVTPSSIPVTVDISKSINFPKLTTPINTFTLPENTRNISLLKVTSDSFDINYEIGGGNIGAAFQINGSTGEVRVSSTGIDYELASSYDLWIIARKKSTPNLATSILIHINVTDENDNEPLFERSYYELSVEEEENGPVYLGTLVATDIDGGLNGKIQYRLNPNSQELYGHLFSIQSESGKMYANTKLDREKKSEYELDVEGIDYGSPQLIGSTAVRIKVLDKNDNPPKFSRLFSVNVTENVPIGTHVIQVTSTDKDVGSNANSTYVFTDNQNTIDLPFILDSVSGNITVSGILDREIQDEYFIRVAAVDGFWRTETLLTITIQDLNDNSPEFEQSYYNFNVAESKDPISIVGRVSASDRDKRGKNSAVSFSLKTPSEYFSLDPLTGELFTKKPLKYRTNRRKNSGENQHNLIIVGSDAGKPQLSSETRVSVNVIDSYNTHPVFPKSKLQVAILENSKVGDEVIQIEAKDTDRGFNSQIEYIIIKENKKSGVHLMNSYKNNKTMFRIDRNSGWIYVNSDLDGRRDEVYLLNIIGRDNGIPPLESTMELLITITGPNFHSPLFTSVNYRVIVPENETPGTTIVTITGTDLDSGPNGRIIYSIKKGNEGGHFKIDEISGGVSLLKELDYEMKKEFNLTILGTDSGFKPKSSSAQLTIQVTDVNDNIPTFIKSNNIANIPENSPPGTYITTIKAIDPDSPKHAQIIYSISNGGKNYFRINESSGSIQSLKEFDYEDKNKYEIQIMASNPDSTLFSTTKLLIQITGINEYIPRFIQPSFQFTISESAPIGTKVGKVEAEDEDSGPDGNVYFYFLGSSNDRGFRILSNTGEIQVGKTLNRSTQSRVVVTVIAKNRGPIRGNDIDEAQVIITITQNQNEFTSGIEIMSPCSPNPCYGGGNCLIRDSNDFSCNCPSGRNGRRCELQENNTNICDWNPCLNGGSCIKKEPGSYFCSCKPGFIGHNCHISSLDSCNPNPCLNGGICHSNTRSCTCRGGFYGNRCEKSGYGFSYGSYMTFPSLDPNTNDISILFATTQTNSLLIYNYGSESEGRSDFIALELLDGKPRFRYGGSRSGIGSLSLNKFVADGKYHRLVGIRSSRAMSLSLSSCTDFGQNCEECRRDDSECSGQDFGQTGTLSFNGNPMYVGGIKDIEPLLSRRDQVKSDDFIGCIQSLEINGRSLNLSSPLEYRGISESCNRNPGICSRNKCGNGECIDLWDSTACKCQSNFIGPNCDEATSPYSIKEGGYIDFHLDEKYKRNLLWRKHEGNHQISISIMFRTTKKDGTLLFSNTEKEFTLLQLSNGGITFRTKVTSNFLINMTIGDLELNDGRWHNIEIIRNSVVLNVLVDGKVIGDDLTSSLTHDFLDSGLTGFKLGGANIDIVGEYGEINYFEGCLLNLTVNGFYQPLNGSGSLLNGITTSEFVLRGCTNGVLASTSPDPLSIGVTLVIIFFVALLIAISLSFIIFRVRKTEKSPLSSPSKSPPPINPNNQTENNTNRSILRNPKKSTNEIPSVKPDIIERNPILNQSTTTSPPPLRRNIISLEPDLPSQILSPEHYDLDNASSIAPSDIDIVYHYKGYRDNYPLPHSHHFRGIRQSPIPHVLKSTPLARLSPSSELSHQTTPRILTLQDISGKSYSNGHGLLHPQDTLLSQSEHSLSSTRSSLGGHHKNSKSGNSSIGLTAEEVERLNGSRHKSHNSSFVSTLHAVSSSDDDRKRIGKNRINPCNINRNRRLSSECESESDNDSYSCSEFEYERKSGYNQHQRTKRRRENQNNKIKADDSFQGSPNYSQSLRNPNEEYV